MNWFKLLAGLAASQIIMLTLVVGVPTARADQALDLLSQTVFRQHQAGQVEVLYELRVDWQRGTGQFTTTDLMTVRFFNGHQVHRHDVHATVQHLHGMFHNGWQPIRHRVTVVSRTSW